MKLFKYFLQYVTLIFSILIYHQYIKAILVVRNIYSIIMKYIICVFSNQNLLFYNVSSFYMIWNFAFICSDLWWKLLWSGQIFLLHKLEDTSLILINNISLYLWGKKICWGKIKHMSNLEIYWNIFIWKKFKKNFFYLFILFFDVFNLNRGSTETYSRLLLHHLFSGGKLSH